MLGGIMTPTHTTCGIMTAVLASAMLSACSSTSADEQQNSQSQPAHQAAAVSSEPTTTDIAEEDARPPFPELGPFDPNLRGEDMPDPCTWATPEIMAELGYTDAMESEVFTDFRDCAYSHRDEEGNPTNRVVTFSMNNTASAHFPGATLAESTVPGLYRTPDELFDFNGYSSVDTTKGMFEVGVSRFDVNEQELQREAQEILEFVYERSK